MELTLKELERQIVTGVTHLLPTDIQEMKEEYLDILKAILWMLDGAEYLWKENAPDN